MVQLVAGVHEIEQAANLISAAERLILPSRWECRMNLDVQSISGPWDVGFSLDRHVLHSSFTGDNEYGHPTFDTTRTDIGEALFQLKYRSDFSQVPIIAQQIHIALGATFQSASFVIPMPPSRHRHRQPVAELARAVAENFNIPCIENLLIKTGQTPQMKDIPDRDEKVRALRGSLQICDVLGDGVFDALIVDDLFDSGASLEAVTLELRGYAKIGKVLVAAVTRKR